MPSRANCLVRHLGLAALLSCAASGQIPDSPPDVVAGIPVNYTEAKAGTYTLPDPLKLNNGKPVTDARTWVEKRRPEIRQLIEENWFGRSPGRPTDMNFEVVEQGTSSFDGKAIRSQVIIYFTKERTGPKMDLLVYLPAEASGPVPLFLNMSFFANNLAVVDPGIKIGRRWDRQSLKQIAAQPPQSGGLSAPTTNNGGPRGLRVEQFIAHGIGVATFNKDDLAPDFVDSEDWGSSPSTSNQARPGPKTTNGVPLPLGHGAASRALDYLESDKRVDPKRVVIHGVSRLGKRRCGQVPSTRDLQW